MVYQRIPAANEDEATYLLNGCSGHRRISIMAIITALTVLLAIWVVRAPVEKEQIRTNTLKDQIQEMTTDTNAEAMALDIGTSDSRDSASRTMEKDRTLPFIPPVSMANHSDQAVNVYAGLCRRILSQSSCDHYFPRFGTFKIFSDYSPLPPPDEVTAIRLRWNSWRRWPLRGIQMGRGPLDVQHYALVEARLQIPQHRNFGTPYRIDSNRLELVLVHESVNASKAISQAKEDVSKEIWQALRTHSSIDPSLQQKVVLLKGELKDAEDRELVAERQKLPEPTAQSIKSLCDDLDGISVHNISHYLRDYVKSQLDQMKHVEEAKLKRMEEEGASLKQKVAQEGREIQREEESKLKTLKETTARIKQDVISQIEANNREQAQRLASLKQEVVTLEKKVTQQFHERKNKEEAKLKRLKQKRDSLHEKVFDAVAAGSAESKKLEADYKQAQNDIANQDQVVQSLRLNTAEESDQSLQHAKDLVVKQRKAMDLLGVYTVNQPRLPVNTNRAINSEQVAVIEQGSTVVVMEFANESGHDLQRARVRSPPGWVSVSGVSVFVQAVHTAEAQADYDYHSDEQKQREKKQQQVVANLNQIRLAERAPSTESYRRKVTQIGKQRKVLNAKNIEFDKVKSALRANVKSAAAMSLNEQIFTKVACFQAHLQDWQELQTSIREVVMTLLESSDVLRSSKLRALSADTIDCLSFPSACSHWRGSWKHLQTLQTKMLKTIHDITIASHKQFVDIIVPLQGSRDPKLLPLLRAFDEQSHTREIINFSLRDGAGLGYSKPYPSAERQSGRLDIVARSQVVPSSWLNSKLGVLTHGSNITISSDLMFRIAPNILNDFAIEDDTARDLRMRGSRDSKIRSKLVFGILCAASCLVVVSLALVIECSKKRSVANDAELSRFQRFIFWLKTDLKGRRRTLTQEQSIVFLGVAFLLGALHIYVLLIPLLKLRHAYCIDGFRWKDHYPYLCYTVICRLTELGLYYQMGGVGIGLLMLLVKLFMGMTGSLDYYTDSMFLAVTYSCRGTAELWGIDLWIVNGTFFLSGVLLLQVLLPFVIAILSPSRRIVMLMKLLNLEVLLDYYTLPEPVKNDSGYDKIGDESAAPSLKRSLGFQKLKALSGLFLTCVRIGGEDGPSIWIQWAYKNQMPTHSQKLANFSICVGLCAAVGGLLFSCLDLITTWSEIIQYEEAETSISKSFRIAWARSVIYCTLHGPKEFSFSEKLATVTRFVEVSDYAAEADRKLRENAQNSITSTINDQNYTTGSLETMLREYEQVIDRETASKAKSMIAEAEIQNKIIESGLEADALDKFIDEQMRKGSLSLSSNTVQRGKDKVKNLRAEAAKKAAEEKAAAEARSRIASFLKINQEEVPSLAVANLERRADATDEIVKEIAQCCKNLSMIYLRDTQVTDDGVKELARNCPSLQIIGLDEAKVTDAGVKDLARHCPSLQKIILSATKVTDIGVKEIATHCAQLHTIGLGETKVTNQGVQEIAKKCANLTYINLANCSSVTDLSIKDLLEKCPKLDAVVVPRRAQFKIPDWKKQYPNVEFE